MRKIWRILKKNQRHFVDQRDKIRGVLTHFRRYYMYLTFKKWRKDTLLHKELNRKDSIKGAQYQLDDFQRKLRLYDAALAKMHREKPSIEDFKALKMSIDTSRNQAMFNDMRDLLDVTASQMRQEVRQIEKKTLMQIEGLKDQHNARVDQIRREQFNMFQERVQLLED